VTLNAPLPTAITPPPPLDPLAGLGRKERAKFRACLDARVGAGSGGTCARLATTRLKQAGFYPWAIPSRVSTTGVNALLNYQRSRGLVATGTTTKATWIALANREPLLPKVLPKTCLTKGIVLCVDQAHRRLYWMRNGKQVRSFKVRLGGYNSHPKTGDWRVFPTANGTWHVYDKQVDPKSENYGSGAMPYSTMFYPDMYVHYSPGFHSVGYAGSSHGCVNIGNLAEAVWIFNHTPIGSKVHIFSPTAA
jgi:lipoprotein-anchoring transpeptidase ErfK/SrfK